MWLFRRKIDCAPKDVVLFMSSEEHSKPLSEDCSWMSTLKVFEKPIGPRFPDGSINWQCPCMAGGSLVAHRCGYLFRPLYICMSNSDKEDNTMKCPEEFVEWVACMQRLSVLISFVTKHVLQPYFAESAHIAMEQKHAVHFLSKKELLEPLAPDLKHLLEPKKDEPSSFLPDGRINEECTCLHSAFAHRCGYLMREAIRCYNSSTMTPRGADCEEYFIRQARCVKKYGGPED